MQGPDEQIRAFIAIDLPVEVKSFILRVASDLKKTGADVKWTRPESTHLTLKFLGNVSGDLVSRLDGLLKPALAHLNPMTLRVQGLGAFPGLARPRVFWIGVQDPENALVSLAHRVESLLEPLGFTPEKRPFSPHLTLGRVRSSKRMGELVNEVRQSMNLPGPTFTADHAVLFQSILKPSGAEYRALAVFPFSGK
jgi:RNA 2',3'-cyclic 3'-phosphodiesterase